MAAQSNDLHQYSIESGIPIAPRNAARSKYPFLVMNVGDSFAFAGDEIERIRQMVYQFQKLHAPMKFTVSAKHRRCWRVA